MKSRPGRRNPRMLTPAKQKKEPPSLRTPQRIIYIKVGNTKESFGLHEHIACFHSPYFRAAFKGNFEEAKSGEVILESTQPEVFGLLVEWLYTQDIPETHCTDENIEEHDRNEQELPSTAHLVNLWLLAEYLQIPKLQNKALNVLRERVLRNSAFHSSLFHLVYEKTMDDSVLRKFFVDMMCWSDFSADLIVQSVSRIQPQMIVDLFTAERKRWMEKIFISPLYDMSNYLVNESVM